MTEPAQPDIFRTWPDIAGALEVDERTAMRYAGRDYDPLPVFYDHADRAWIYRAALGSWVHRQNLPHHAYHELRASGRLPGQIRSNGAKKRRSKAGDRDTSGTVRR